MKHGDSVPQCVRLASGNAGTAPAVAVVTAPVTAMASVSVFKWLLVVDALPPARLKMLLPQGTSIALSGPPLCRLRVMLTGPREPRFL
jgi:hypothetical protein